MTADGTAGPAVAERVRRPGNEFVKYGGVTESPGTAPQWTRHRPVRPTTRNDGPTVGYFAGTTECL